MFDNLDDPKRQALLALAAGLLTPVRQKGAAGFGAALSNGIQGGLLGFNQASQQQRRNKLTDIQEQMAKMQLANANRDEEFRKSVQYSPSAPIPYNDTLGSEAPQGPVGMSAPKFDLSKAYGIDPIKAAQLEKSLMAQDAPITLKEGEVAFNRDGTQRFSNPKSQTPQERFSVIPQGDPRLKGLPPGAYQVGDIHGKISQVGASPPQVNVNLPAPEKAILKADEETLVKLTEAANASRMYASTTDIITNALKGKGGGTVIKLGAETARFLGLKNNVVTANDLAESLNTRTAVQVRAPGSGQTSNIEFEAYKQAVPSLKNSEAGRALMQKAARLFAQRDAKLADHARKLIREGKFSYENIAAYDEKLGSVLGADLEKFTSAGSSGGVVDFNSLP